MMIELVSVGAGEKNVFQMMLKRTDGRQFVAGWWDSVTETTVTSRFIITFGRAKLQTAAEVIQVNSENCWTMSLSISH